MQNPLLSDATLPAFTSIRPEHVEPAIRELLALNRARIEELAGLAEPSFATLVEPLEELDHRLTRRRTASGFDGAGSPECSTATRGWRCSVSTALRLIPGGAAARRRTHAA